LYFPQWHSSPGGTEDALAEKTVALRTERAVVDRLRFVTSPCDHDMIVSGDANESFSASKF